MTKPKQVLPLADHIDKALRKYRRGIPLAGALTVSLIFGITSLLFAVRSDIRLLRSLSPHVSSFVESNDRPDLQRMVRSIADRERVDLLVVKDDLITASSRDLSEIDRPFELKGTFFVGKLSQLTASGLVTNVSIERPGGPSDLNAMLVMFTPLSSVLYWSSFIAVLVFGLGLLVSALFYERLSLAITASVKPVADLDTAIRGLRNMNDPAPIPSTGIQELEQIRDSITETHGALVNARDALAAARAKELATDAYVRLIHDLHNPVASLGQWIKLSHASYDEETRREATEKIPKLAEQILNQVTVAKDNLNFEAATLESADIRECVREATDQAKLASIKIESVSIERILPELPVIVHHDPTLLNRAVSNLVKNALDACRDKVRVVVEKHSSETHIQVMDDGPGLSQEDAGLYLQGRLRSTKGDRQAYGLAAANHIIRTHGGRIVYRRSELGGACFEIRI